MLNLIMLIDFDGDDMLGKTDLLCVLERLIGCNSISPNEMEQMVQV